MTPLPSNSSRVASIYANDSPSFRSHSQGTRGRCKGTALPAGPCLFGLYTVVAVLSDALPAGERVGAAAWPGKATVTFSDAMCAVRRWLRHEAVLPQAGDGSAQQKLPEPVRGLLLTTLAPAA